MGIQFGLLCCGMKEEREQRVGEQMMENATRDPGGGRGLELEKSKREAWKGEGCCFSTQNHALKLRRKSNGPHEGQGNVREPDYSG